MAGFVQGDPPRGIGAEEEGEQASTYIPADNLVVAAVVDETELLDEARAKVMREAVQAEVIPTKRQKFFRPFAALSVLLTIALAVGLGVGMSRRRNSSRDGVLEDRLSPSTISPSSLAPSQVPYLSLSPTLSRLEALREVLLQY